MVLQGAAANATRDNDPRGQTMFRDTARQNVTASLIDLRNARSALSLK